MLGSFQATILSQKDNGLLAWYPLTSDANDIGPYKYHGSVLGAPSFAAGGVTFDGIDDRIQLPAALAPSFGTMIWSAKAASGLKVLMGAWITATSATKYYPIVVAMGGNITGTFANEAFGYSSFITAATPQEVVVDNSSTDGYSDGTMRRFAITIDAAGNAQLYVAGSAVTTQLGTKTAGRFLATNHPNNLGLSLGARKYDLSGSVTEQFTASTLKDIKIYNRVLSAAEIAAS